MEVGRRLNFNREKTLCAEVMGGGGVETERMVFLYLLTVVYSRKF
jgi:hypothetical protein